MSIGNQLIRYDQARIALYEARTVDDAKNIKDKAEALLVYARQRKDVEMEAWLAEIKLRAERRIGDLSAELEKPTKFVPGKGHLLPDGGKQTKSGALKAAGISTSVADRCEKIAAMPEDQFDAYIEQQKAKGQQVTASEVYRKVTKEKQRERKKEERAARTGGDPKNTIGLHNEPCSNALNGEAESVDWVITDPPYPQEFLPLYDTLAEVAEHSLKPGGSLLCMVGQSYLPDVVASLAKRLTYHWTLAYLTPGGQAVQIFPRKINTFWKPVLWFVKGEYQGGWIGDVSRSKPNDNDKRFHEWGQSESGFRDLMSRFVKPGEVVLDPFMGAGTTGVIALELGARFVGFDDDKKAFSEAVGRLERAKLVA